MPQTFRVGDHVLIREDLHGGGTVGVVTRVRGNPRQKYKLYSVSDGESPLGEYSAAHLSAVMVVYGENLGDKSLSLLREENTALRTDLQRLRRLCHGASSVVYQIAAAYERERGAGGDDFLRNMYEELRDA